MQNTSDPLKLEISDGHARLRREAREFAEREIAPVARSMDVQQAFPQRLFERLAEAGFAGVGVPHQFKGSFTDYRSVVVIGEEFARVSASVPVALFPHAMLCAHNIVLSGTEEQKARCLPDLASGKKWGAMALAEAAAGSDILSMRTRAVKSGAAYVLNGAKTLITNVPFADVYLVFAKTSAAKEPGAVSAFIVEKEAAGFGVGKLFDKMGMRGSPTGRIRFRACRVKKEDLVGGREGEGYRQLLAGMDPERVSWASIALGVARASLDAALWYAGRRKQFGRTIDGFQMIQGMIADMGVDFQAARLLVYHAAGLLDRGEEARLAASSAKLFASEAAVRIAGDAVQIHGGAGYMKARAVERYFRDAKVLTVAAGSSEIQRLIIAHELRRKTAPGTKGERRKQPSSG